MSTGAPVRDRLEFPVTVCPTCSRLGPLVEACPLTRCPHELTTVHSEAELRAIAGRMNSGPNDRRET